MIVENEQRCILRLTRNERAEKVRFSYTDRAEQQEAEICLSVALKQPRRFERAGNALRNQRLPVAGPPRSFYSAHSRSPHYFNENTALIKKKWRPDVAAAQSAALSIFSVFTKVDQRGPASQQSLQNIVSAHVPDAESDFKEIWHQGAY